MPDGAAADIGRAAFSTVCLLGSFHFTVTLSGAAAIVHAHPTGRRTEK
jgi:hypothetical protein